MMLPGVPESLVTDDLCGRTSSLSGLRLTSEDLHALRAQGFVSSARYGKDRLVFTLRFRRGGKQSVRYIGSDPARAEQIRSDLAALQEPRRLDLQLAALNRKARRMLREAKVHLEPVLNAAGYAFHGQAIRRCRSCPVESTRILPPVDHFNALREQHDVER